MNGEKPKDRVIPIRNFQTEYNYGDRKQINGWLGLEVGVKTKT